MAQYLPWEILPREVLDGLHISPVSEQLKVSVSKGCWRIGYQVIEIKEAVELTLDATAANVAAIYANPDGTVSLYDAATYEDDKAAAWTATGGSHVYTGTKSRSLKIGEVTVAKDATAVTADKISEKARFEFDKMRSEMNGQHVEYTTAYLGA